MLIGTLLTVILTLFEGVFNICGASLFTIPKFHKKVQMPAATPFVFVVIPYFSALKKRIYLWKSLTFGRFLYIIIVSYYKECKLWEPLFFGSFSG